MKGRARQPRHRGGGRTIRRTPCQPTSVTANTTHARRCQSLSGRTSRCEPVAPARSANVSVGQPFETVKNRHMAYRVAEEGGFRRLRSPLIRTLRVIGSRFLSFPEVFLSHSDSRGIPGKGPTQLFGFAPGKNSAAQDCRCKTCQARALHTLAVKGLERTRRRSPSGRSLALPVNTVSSTFRGECGADTCCRDPSHGKRNGCDVDHSAGFLTHHAAVQWLHESDGRLREWREPKHTEEALAINRGLQDELKGQQTDRRPLDRTGADSCPPQRRAGNCLQGPGS